MFEGKARSIFGMDVETSNNEQQHVFLTSSNGDAHSEDCLNIRAKHTLKNSRGAIRRCKLCRKTFRNQNNFLAHCKLHKVKKHGKGKNIYLQEMFSCKLCHTNITGLSEFVIHMKSHNTIYQDSRYLNDGEHSKNLEQTSDSTNNTEVIIGSVTTAATSAVSSLDLRQVENDHQRQHAENINNGQGMNLDGQHLPNMVTEVLPDLPITSSLAPSNAIGGHHGNSETTNHHPQTTLGAPDGLHIEIPTHVKALFFNNQSNNSNNSSHDMDYIVKNIECLNNKLDIIIKHLNIPLDEEGNPLPPATNTIEVRQPSHAAPTNDQERSNIEETEEEEGGTTVLLEGFPPSYSLVQAAKEQQQQEFYALTLSSRQAQQVFKTEANTTTIATSPNDLKLLKGKGMDLWVPASSHYLSQIATLTESQPEETNELTIAIPTTTSNTTTATIPCNVVDKIFVESRSRANFAKNLTFAIFSQEERKGKNCTGRVFGKAQHKGQLDPVKLGAVKEATFRKYPCNPNLVDITWRKECITAIDSGLRNENRSSSLKSNSHQHHQHQLVDRTTDIQIHT